MRPQGRLRRPYSRSVAISKAGTQFPGMMEPPNRIVHRYQRVTYHGLGGVEAHGKRLGDDLDHVDASRSHLNEFLVGHENLRDIAAEHIVRMQKDNAARKAAGLRRSRHKANARELEEAIDVAGDDPSALAEIIGWPWDDKNVKPFTEGIISASHEWFLDGDGKEDPAKISIFRDFVVGYLKEEFGDEVIYARFDRDEKTPHISFVVAPEHENRKTKRRELSHRQHRVFGRKEVQAFFDDEELDPNLTRKSYEILQDRIAEYAKRQGLDLKRGQRRAAQERMQRHLGEKVVKRRNVSPARGREIAGIEAYNASEDRNAAAAERAAAERDRASADDLRLEAAHALEIACASRSEAEQQHAAAARERALLKAKEDSIRIGTQAIISEELVYSPPTSERPEGLTWGRNKPNDKKRRTWLSEKIQPARDWLVGFARSIFGFQTQKAATQAEQESRAKSILDAEAMQGRRPSQTMLDIVNGPGDVPEDQLETPNAWALPNEMTPEQIDRHLAGMTNTDICDTYAPTRDARDFSEHHDIQARYRAALEHLQEEAARRGLNVEHREHRPEKGSDPVRARLHLDSPPAPMRVVRRDATQVR
ncbi:MAG: hypothetical protein CMN19_13285 [Roseovarius sp.]|nr:hypothetical protein [Roseovarius sp.]